MAIKKSALYTSLYASCDQLRGGMDPTLYKNYILTLLFVKYVSDKFKGKPFAPVTVPEGGSFDDFVAAKGHPQIGEKIDIALSKLSDANPQLTGIFREVHFNDETRLGKGEDMVRKVTNLITIFQGDNFDFSRNKASGDDILGDAYEYLMRRFAIDSGKSKGQFYTPAEASRVLAGLLGLGKLAPRVGSPYTIYDGACGSGSLLIRAADTAPKGVRVSLYGQEYDPVTAGLAKMNLVLHNRATGEIKIGNTFADPQFLDAGGGIQRFDFGTLNPPFSYKSWSNGITDMSRFKGYGDMPPEKNGDFAWLLHMVRSLSATGRAAVILPLGVLFRGNAEGTIRQNIVERGLIEGIVAFPANIFYGTGIPACVIVIDKAGAAARKGIFMVDASRGFVKDGNKNRLRERDIRKILDAYETRTAMPHFARFVPMDEIRANGYNLNLPRYIDSGDREDVQDIAAHLHGGIPSADLDALAAYWSAFPGLRASLFKPLRPGYETLRPQLPTMRAHIQGGTDFRAYAAGLARAFKAWHDEVAPLFHGITDKTEGKRFIDAPARSLFERFLPHSLLDTYDVYEVLLSYWTETMADDVLLVAESGYEVGREIEAETKTDRKGRVKVGKWEGRIIPRDLIARTFFAEEHRALSGMESEAEAAEVEFDGYVEEESGEDGVLRAFIDDDDLLDLDKLSAAIKAAKKSRVKSDEEKRLLRYEELEKLMKSAAQKAKACREELDTLEYGKYSALTEEELHDLIVERKWFRTVYAGIETLFTAVSNHLVERITELAERYDRTLSDLDAEGDALEAKVAGHLKEMGY